VNSVRGPGGGYLLGREAFDIAVGEVIIAVDESVDATKCQGLGDCQDGVQCLTHYLWVDLSNRIQEFMNGISLGDLVKNKDVLSVAGRQDREHKKFMMTDSIEVNCQL